MPQGWCSNSRRRTDPTSTTFSMWVRCDQGLTAQGSRLLRSTSPVAEALAEYDFFNSMTVSRRSACKARPLCVRLDRVEASVGPRNACPWVTCRMARQSVCKRIQITRREYAGVPKVEIVHEGRRQPPQRMQIASKPEGASARGLVGKWRVKPGPEVIPAQDPTAQCESGFERRALVGHSRRASPFTAATGQPRDPLVRTVPRM